ncbi:MAG: hypothetical protein QOI82_3443 [Actinomycetota bacterium]|jgi:uncharacterized protein YkwD|nr:hypothetical protein [Actinomycetota bacterium]
MRISTRWAAAAAVGFALVTASTAAYADDSSPTPAPTAAPAPGYSATGTWQLLALVNKHRHALGMPALTIDTRLAAIARKHTESMAATGVLRHNDALFTSASHQALGMKAFGENVGWNYSVSAQDAAFLNSPLHRANIETRSFRVAGFAVVRGADGRIWSTEDFGTPN